MNRAKYDLTHRNIYFLITYVLLIIIGIISLIVLKTSSNITKLFVLVLCLLLVLDVYIYDYFRYKIIHLKKYIGSVLNPDSCSNLDEITKQSPMFWSVVAGICFVIIIGIALIINSGMCLKYLSSNDNPMECNVLIILIGINLMVLSIYVSMNLTNIGGLHDDINKLAKKYKTTLQPNRTMFQIFWLVFSFAILVGICIKMLLDKSLTIQLGSKGIICLFILMVAFSNFIDYNITYIQSNLFNGMNPDARTT